MSPSFSRFSAGRTLARGLPGGTTSSSKVTCLTRAGRGFRTQGRGVRLHGHHTRGHGGHTTEAVLTPGDNGTPGDLPVLPGHLMPPHLEKQLAAGQAEQCCEEDEDESGCQHPGQVGAAGKEGAMAQPPRVTALTYATAR